MDRSSLTLAIDIKREVDPVIEIKKEVEKLADEAEKIIIGKRHEIKLFAVALISKGHILIDDVPGTGKTTLVKTAASALRCRFSRIQFVSDSMPGDVIGMNVYNQKTGDFEVRKGPVFTNLLLADEINRAMPRTQSALLEAMEEKQVTIDGTTFGLPEPFMVIATENPVEYESTFNLPVAQLDRFFMKITLGYPDEKSEIRMLETSGDMPDTDRIEKITDAEGLKEIQRAVEDIYVSDEVRNYIVKIIRKTRMNDTLLMGASPRATKHLYRASKAWAAISGRDFVTPDDVCEMAVPVLEHRLIANSRMHLDHEDKRAVIESILDGTEVEK